ncbi:GNAT family N-acetyltransferase [Tessaracoccus sp.]
MTSAIKPTQLIGELVTLEPLGPQHDNELSKAVVDGHLSTLWYANVPSPEGMGAEIERRLALQDEGSMLPFTIRRRSDESVLGMTTFMHIDRSTPRVEIGSTWIRASASGTGANVDAKLLMLRQAFNVWGCPAVEFRTHWMNLQSKAAIERLGAKLDGVLRSHSRTRDGALRDTCVYSIIDSEWPAVEAGLVARLDRHRRGQG